MQIGNYKIISQLGEGSFGRTFLGEHALLKIPVCIKQEKTGVKPSTDLFREEASIIGRLRHPSLPSFMDYFEQPLPVGQILILSYIEGRSLDEVIKTEILSDGTVLARRPIDDEHICWIIDRILGAVSYLHGRWHIVHCDLKPANIILDTKDHNATLVDLGMASADPVEWSKAKGGTPGYIPPEFGLSLPPIPSSDIYSIGKIVCAISGGDHLKSEFAKDMNPELINFFEPWIRQDPNCRPQNADVLRTELFKLRKKIFSRTSCKEEFKFRNTTNRS